MSQSRLAACGGRRVRTLGPMVLLLLTSLLSEFPAVAQPIAQGTSYLLATQQAGGEWQSSTVRSSQATAEALRALQSVAPGAAAARAAAANFLETATILDSDDRAQRLLALEGEGRDVSGLVGDLLADRDLKGGWGLTGSFVNDPLDTALVLQALTGNSALDDEILRLGLLRLIVNQRVDGGFPCTSGEATDADSDAYCTAHAVLGLLPSSSRFALAGEIDLAVAALQGQRNGDGSFGATGDDQLIRTALASLAVAAVPAFGNEVAAVISYLEGRQQPDGSWDGDPFSTALVLRALSALASVPFCGDGLVNSPGEACDGGLPAGFGCEDLGLGAGTLVCSAQCTFDTSACSAPPVCGDNLRNLPFEICDGTDLAGQSCTSQGFAAGNLGCASDCLTFDVSTCSAAASCGDGVINQPSEACDLSDLGGLTCAALGLGNGLLQCDSGCGLDTSGCDAATFEIDNKGREFFVGFLPNPLLPATASVHLTSDLPTTVTVQYPVVTPSFSQTVNLTPGQVTVVNLPNGSHNSWTAGRILNNLVRVSGAEEHVVYLVNRAQFTSDAGMALPVDALGNSYIVTTMRGSAIVGADRSQFLVMAPFDGTTVTITPTTTVRRQPPDSNNPAGVPFQITLQRGEGFRGEALSFGADLTGTLIEADRPIAVLGGNICTNVPQTTSFCDHIFEVMHPRVSWGNSALVANLPNRPGGSLYRVVASEDNTEVSLDGAPVATLQRGQFAQLGPLAGSHLFAADQPIFVTQFMTGSRSPGASLGDPAMANMIPPDQYLESYTFSTVGGSQFALHFLTVVAPDTSVGSLLLDGSPIPAGQFSPIGSTGFSSAIVTLSEGTHTTDSPEPHGITVEGINQDDSYIYPGGARLAFINEFCGDGRVNRSQEECDGNDFQGATCGAFGFSSGFLACTADCRVDISNCTGIGADDADDDGFPSVDDCDDNNPDVNPGQMEIPGNGIDDDCNPATPDEIPAAALRCDLFSNQLTYGVTELVGLLARVENLDSALSLSSLSTTVDVRDSGSAMVFSETRSLASLPPGGRVEDTYSYAAIGQAPGAYLAQAQILAAGEVLATCSVGFAIDSSAASGAGISGTLVLDPTTVNAGDSSDATYTVENLGNEAVTDLALSIILVDPDTGGQLAELTDITTLLPAETFIATQAFSTMGLLPRTYLAILIATLSDSGMALTLDEALLTVVNVPPDCSEANATPDELWPPNHQFVPVTVLGVTDGDDDPITLTISRIFQDEPVDAKGSGNTCPDATGVGGASASVRSERQGSGDGRVMHIFFTADDGRGGSCEGSVTVCVPKSQGGSGAVCVDQGPIYDATVCP